MTEMKEYSQMTESHRGGGVFQPRDISNDRKEKDFATSNDQVKPHSAFYSDSIGNVSIFHRRFNMGDKA